jgi:uncharacterized protein (TIGR02145 family)
MKKIFTLILGIIFAFSCSTSSDGNGNSNTTVVPFAPSNLTGTVASSTQINLSWTDNSTNEAGFKIERKTGTGVYAVVGTTATDITTYSDNGLTPNTSYTYRVYSNNAVGNSLTYSNELTLTTIPPLVTIGSQTWMQTNLNVTKYRNGDIIPQVTNSAEWTSLTTGAWCYYNNDPSTEIIYGKLYNWYAVNDPRNIAPLGFHLFNEAEFNTLVNYLGGANLSGGKMKETGTSHWISPNTGATNISGFTALPGGYRDYNGGVFRDIGLGGNWWISTNSTLHFYLSYNNTNVAVDGGTNGRRYGFSVRLIKD